MRRRDREVTDFETILDIIDECNIIRIGLAEARTNNHRSVFSTSGRYRNIFLRL